MIDDDVNCLVAATLAAAKAASEDYQTREEYIAEYESMLEALLLSKKRNDQPTL